MSHGLDRLAITISRPFVIPTVASEPSLANQFEVEPLSAPLPNIERQVPGRHRFQPKDVLAWKPGCSRHAHADNTVRSREIAINRLAVRIERSVPVTGMTVAMIANRDIYRGAGFGQYGLPIAFVSTWTPTVNMVAGTRSSNGTWRIFSLPDGGPSSNVR